MEFSSEKRPALDPVADEDEGWANPGAACFRTSSEGEVLGVVLFLYIRPVRDLRELRRFWVDSCSFFGSFLHGV